MQIEHLVFKQADTVICRHVTAELFRTFGGQSRELSRRRPHTSLPEKVDHLLGMQLYVGGKVLGCSSWQSQHLPPHSGDLDRGAGNAHGGT